MSEIKIPKGAELLHVQFTVRTASNKADEQAGYGSLRVFVRKNGAPYTAAKAKTELTFLLNQGIIDEYWQVIPWGNGFAVAPITNI